MTIVAVAVATVVVDTVVVTEIGMIVVHREAIIAVDLIWRQCDVWLSNVATVSALAKASASTVVATGIGECVFALCCVPIVCWPTVVFATILNAFVIER